MKRTKKIVSLLCLVAMLVSAFALTLVSAAEYVMEKPVEASKWTNATFSTDHAYSFAFVGDHQFVTIGDYLLGTEKLQYQYKFIADTAEERKLEHVFVLGDMTDWGYRNDSNLASAHNDPPITGEWEIVKSAISQLDGVVPYSLVRGNHDDYMIDDYFNVPAYTDLFKDCGGFFSYNGTQAQKREKKNPDSCIYWSAVTGCHDESIVNSWKTVEIYGTKYLFITYDYNPTPQVVNWLDDILGQYPDHKAILTTHSYLMEDGTRATPEEETGNTNNYLGLTGSILWDRVFKKHANVFMIVSGHTGNEYVNYSYARGDNGNKVLQVLVDPQAYETREINIKGDMWDQGRNVQDVGLVLYMNFSEDGKRITFDNYSTLLGKFLKNQDFTINLDGENDQDGYIDMAAFSDKTAVVENMTTVTLDGAINDGEYGYSRTVSKSEIAKGSLAGDLTEYFAYDNDYIYYAFKTQGTGLSQNTINIHPGSSLYTREQLNQGDHTLSGDFLFSNGTFKLNSSNIFSTPIEEDNDLACKAVYDKSTKTVTYELRVRREYLANNGSPDNLFSYTLTFNGAEHYYKLNADDKAALEELGVNKKFIWTYNYVYFGTRPEATEVPPIETEAPKTEAPVEQTDAEPVKTKGCKSSLAIASIAFIPVLAGAALFAKKRNDD